MELEDLIFDNAAPIDLSRFRISQQDMSQLVGASINWLSSIGMPRPESPAAQVLDVLKKCYVPEPENRSVLQ